ncbi:hemolysin III [Burkholderia sp. K24]|jgi:ABC-type branched-subunit amino acid transport system ATPase component|uniref:ABC transporter ATP-binding protein n=1 Tax=Paraburkholderia fungorum TaxID=134537 RepID=UPI0004ABD144|nr:ABC transporter ATP-binding protein [Paraburkholderia fungorum]KFX63936.1 hemolysin III [Burkholderia sp. K24]MBU7436193.1 ABC transporter ATP-binding protein [Paraburkholderia fungorum]
MNAALETKGLQKTFGALVVADSINFRLEKGVRHALIGPNGAGKTTFVNLLTGRLKPSSGNVLLDGHDITRQPPAERVKSGLGRTFQINALFNDLSVLDNVCLAVAERMGTGYGWWRPASAYSEVIGEATALLDSLGLANDRKKYVRDLPYGKQRLVEIAIALGLRPNVLLLDEPAAGVPSHESHIIFDVLERLPGEISILFIEHDMDLVFRFASRITVLSAGAMLAEGTPTEIKENPIVRNVYLGESHV